MLYPSQLVSINYRELAKAQRIRTVLGGSANLVQPFPVKPKYMRWKKYWRLRTQYEQLESAFLKTTARWLPRGPLSQSRDS